MFLSFCKIRILFQIQDGSHDHDSPSVWWTAPGSLSARRRADWKVSRSQRKTVKETDDQLQEYFGVSEPGQAIVQNSKREQSSEMLSRDGELPLSVSLESKISAVYWIISSFSYIIEQQTCFLTLTEKQFSKKVAYSFLEDLAGEFHSQYGHKINTATRPYSFIEFDTYIQVRSNDGLLSWITDLYCRKPRRPTAIREAGGTWQISTLNFRTSRGSWSRTLTTSSREGPSSVSWRTRARTWQRWAGSTGKMLSRWMPLPWLWSQV